MVASANRVALMRELRGAPEPSLGELLRLLKTVDLVLVEGFKRDPLPKIEVFRTANGKPPLYPDDRNIVALISDGSPSDGLPHASIDDICRRGGSCARACEAARRRSSRSSRACWRLTFAALRASFDDATMPP